MRLSSYLLTEGRGVAITEEKAVYLLNKNCKRSVKAWKRGDGIYRGIPSNNSFMLYDTKTSLKPRESANAENYYTLLIDNSPAWKKFPKRSQSLICTTNDGYASGYGSTFIVFPYDNGVIGVSPDDDFWFSFQSTLRESLNRWTNSLNRVFQRLDIDLSDKSYEGIVKSFKEFDDTMKVSGGESGLTSLIISTGADWLKNYFDYNNILKLVDDKLNPSNNNFKLVKAGYPLPDKKVEVWTDAKSVLVEYNFNHDNYPIDKIKDQI